MNSVATARAIQGSGKPAVSDAEWQVRVELAACYRLVAHFGWDELIYNHISARAPGEPDHFLVNPFGLMFEEIRASDLIKVDAEGNLADDSEGWGINPAGFILHSAVHDGRPDVNCVIHFHTTAGVAVSAHPEGLLPISQDGLIYFDEIGYHDFEGILFDPSEKETLLANMGAANIVFLRNHGTLACGATVAAAFHRAYIAEKACQIQVAALSQGAEPKRVPQPIVQRAVEQIKPFLGEETHGRRPFDALMRKLDRMDPSYRE